MSERSQRMSAEHTWAGVAHDLAYLGAHIGTVAMNGTMLARRLLLAETAMRQTCHGVLLQSRACRTETISRTVKVVMVVAAVMGLAVNLYHPAHYLLLAFYACHVNSKPTKLTLNSNL